MVFIKEEINRLKHNLIEDNDGIDVYLYNYINGIENKTDISDPINSKELANGIAKIINNPNLSNKQMRVIWMSKKNGAKSEVFNKPEYSVDSMKFYADIIYTNEDEKVCKEMLKHPELSVSELNELYDCVLDGVDYKDFIGKSDSDIFIERERALNSKKVDNRTPEQRDFEVFDKAIAAAMILKGLV